MQNEKFTAVNRIHLLHGLTDSVHTCVFYTAAKGLDLLSNLSLVTLTSY